MKPKRPTLNAQNRTYHSTLATYGKMYRPDDAMDVCDPVPIIPPVEKQVRKNQFRRDYHREVAWTIDYRGDNDDIPTLLFAGAGYTLVKKVFMLMFGKSSPLFTRATIYRTSHVFQRQGKAWVRIAVELRGYKSEIMSLEDFGTVIGQKMQQECLCNVKYMKLNKFLNI